MGVAVVLFVTAWADDGANPRNTRAAARAASKRTLTIGGSTWRSVTCRDATAGIVVHGNGSPMLWSWQHPDRHTFENDHRGLLLDGRLAGPAATSPWTTRQQATPTPLDGAEAALASARIMDVVHGHLSRPVLRCSTRPWSTSRSGSRRPGTPRASRRRAAFMAKAALGLRLGTLRPPEESLRHTADLSAPS